MSSPLTVVRSGGVTKPPTKSGVVQKQKQTTTARAELQRELVPEDPPLRPTPDTYDAPQLSFTALDG